MMNESIPFYNLYGEVFISKEPDLVHVEDIAYRSTDLHWEIAPHRHSKLSQLIVVLDNQWTVKLDDKTHFLEGNWLVLIPAGTVHGFQFKPNTQGFVLSLNDAYLSGVESENIDTNLSSIIWQPQAVEFKDNYQLDRFKTYMDLLNHELNYNELGQGLAVKQLVQLILLSVMRQQKLQEMNTEKTSRESHVLLKFRALIENHYNQHLPVTFYAEQLFISTSKLNRLCQYLLNDSPKAIIHQRLIIESKRRLIYTRQSVEEISAMLGFTDTAYFCRFFKKMTELTPSVFREKGNMT
jgi:AraC family transcriptional activator of pobA